MKGMITQRDVLSKADIHDILSNGRRRRIIEELRNGFGEVTLRDLAETIAEIETSQSPAPRDVRQSVYNSLHQTHLPRLDEEGIIEYDRDRKTILLTEECYHVDIYMEVVTKYGITWSQYYRVLGIFAIVTALLAATDAPFFSIIDTTLWLGGFLGLFFLSTIVQLWPRRWLYFRQFLSWIGITGHKSLRRR